MAAFMPGDQCKWQWENILFHFRSLINTFCSPRIHHIDDDWNENDDDTRNINEIVQIYEICNSPAPSSRSFCVDMEHGAQAYRYREISNICLLAAVNSVKYYHISLWVIYIDIIWIRKIKRNENDISAYNIATTEADKVNSMLNIKQWILVYSCTTSAST